ncbi:MAG: molybdopterin-dependent oxidoreductase, partial [Sandarakinorhabdus sp.]|nr:molybdopterin-dependent oxidoreductase [Sandarakinorhabdus sp.]
DAEYLAVHRETPGVFWQALAPADQPPAAVAADCGLAEADVLAFFALFAAHPRTVTAWSQGSNQSQNGTDNVTAILNVHLATGRIGKPGAAPLSLTGQPNAMGGREVGGLASSLAAHISFDDRDSAQTIRRFWNAPALATRPGLKAVDLFKALGDGRIKALWIIATNPAVSMPELAAVRAALAEAPFVVVSDVTDQTDTLGFADVRLPALAWGEKAGSVTNSERRVSLQRAFLPPPGLARADWWALAQLAARLGFASDFAWGSADEIRAEHMALTAATNRHLTLAEPEGQWPAGAPRLFADGGFPTPTGKARLVSIAPPLLAAADPALPFTLNTGRIRDQWHTMTRTGRVPRLGGHRAEPFVAIHPDDAAGLADGSLARVTTAQGSELFRVQHDTGQRSGSLFVPIHWSRSLAAGGLAGALAAANPDPVSGQPAFKHSRAAIAAHRTDWQGFLLTRQAVRPAAEWWVEVAAEGCHRYEIAGTGGLAAAADVLLKPSAGQLVSEVEDGNRTLRRALFTAGRLDALLFIGQGALPSRDWLALQFAAGQPEASLLAGAPAGARSDDGAQICACFNIGLKTLTAAIRDDGLSDVAAIGAALGAGSNCGSCKPELARLLRDLKESVDG